MMGREGVTVGASHSMPTLTSLLARDEIVSVDMIEEALQRQVLEEGEIDSALLELDALPENVLSSYRAAIFGLAPASRRHVMGADPGALELLSREVAQALDAVPLSRDGDTLIVAAVSPPDESELDALESKLGLQLELRISNEPRIAGALERHYGIEPPSRLRRLLQKLADRDPGEVLEVDAGFSDAPSDRARDRSGKAPGDTPQEALEVPKPAPLPAELSGPPRVRSSADTTTVGAVLEPVRPVQVAPVVSLGRQGGAAQSKPGVAASDSSPASDVHSALERAAIRSARPPAAEAPGVGAGAGGQAAESPSRPAPQGSVGRASRIPAPRPHSPSMRRIGKGPRGPLTRDGAIERLKEAADRDEVLDVVFAFARQYFDATVLFSVREGHVLGVESSGLPALADPRSIDVEIDAGSVDEVLVSGLARVFDLSRRAEDRAVVASLGRAAAQPAALIPVSIRRRIVALLYGDREGQDFHIDELADLIELLPEVSRAFERIIRNRKLLATGSSAARRPAAPAGVYSPNRAAGRERRRARATHAGLHPLADAVTGETPARVVEAMTAGQVSSRLTEEALSSLGVRSAAPPPPPNAERTTASFERSVAMAQTVRLSDAKSSKEPKRQSSSPPATSQPPPPARFVPPVEVTQARRGGTLRPGARSDREITRPSRPANVHSSESSLAGAPLRTSPPPPRTLSQPPPGTGGYAVGDRAPELLGVRPQPRRPSGPAPGSAGKPQPQRPTPAERPAGLPRDLRREADDSGQLPKAERVSPAVHDSIRPPADTDATARAAVAVPPSAPLPSVASEAETLSAAVEALPQEDSGAAKSVVIDLGADAERLVDELCASGPDEEGPAVASLLRLGDHGLQAVAKRFPGPLWLDRAQILTRAPAGRDLGPIPRALTAFDDRATPQLAALLDHESPDARLYAVLLASDRVRPELLWPLYERLYDADGTVRRVVSEILPHFRNVAGFDQVREALRQKVGDDGQAMQHRLSALEALSTLRDAGSAALLVGLSSHRERQLSIPAHRALVAISGHDFGNSARKWRAWLAKSSGRHRTEWLIDGLSQPDERVRAIASAELQKMTQVYYGFVPGAPRRERELAQRRYREWWSTQGKAQFGVR
ncbi:MAG: hypothetical protein OEZ06_20215 [Myxococcales bacterium]|nr:hypothetical protein [Myxococcales bacterium]